MTCACVRRAVVLNTAHASWSCSRMDMVVLDEFYFKLKIYSHCMHQNRKTFCLYTKTCRPDQFPLLITTFFKWSVVVSEFCLGVTNLRKLTHPTNHSNHGRSGA